MKNRGFTLLELIVVISIILIVSTISIASYNNITDEKKLEDEAKKLVSVLNLASKKTAAGENPNPGYCTNNYQGFAVRAKETSDEYYLSFCCQDLQNANAFAECFQDPDNANLMEIQNYKLPSGFELDLSTDRFGSVLFKVNSSGAFIRERPDGSNISSLTLTVKNTKFNKCIPITVTNYGVITEGQKVTCN